MAIWIVDHTIWIGNHILNELIVNEKEEFELYHCWNTQLGISQELENAASLAAGDYQVW